MMSSRLMNDAFQLLEKAKRNELTDLERKEMSVELAGIILSEARRVQTSRESEVQDQLARMMDDVRGKAFTTAMTDQGFRSNNTWRVANQISYLLDKYGVPKYLSASKRIMLSLFHTFGKMLAPITVPLVKQVLRKETSTVILPGETQPMLRHMRMRRREGVRINLNRLGEAILGEEEANHRLQVYLDDLKNPEVECISVKISTLYSQIHLIGWEESLEVLMEKLKKLYRAAQENEFTLPNGTKVQKFINLDMEEYRDLHLTVDLFRRTLNEPEFFKFSAGLVLQSYLPDSFLIQQELTSWAMQRVANGGAPIKIRIVKGANLAMEQVEASLREWEQSPYFSKHDVDANFKRMIAFGCQPEHAKAVHLGIASHNLFHVAYGMILRAEKSIEKYVCFEMLEGMSDHARRVIQTLSRDVLLYCPVAKKEEFQNAIAYLIRRLDENTAPENFLRHAFNMMPGSKDWQEQVNFFTSSFQAANRVATHPNRRQNRYDPPAKCAFDSPFHNEPDTDWSLLQNRLWGKRIVEQWKEKKIERIPLVIGGDKIDSGVDFAGAEDPSRPGKIFYSYALGNERSLDRLLRASQHGLEMWNEKSFHERMMILEKAAYLFKVKRGDLIGSMTADTGKTVMEGDVEVSEAVDFIEYYRRCIEELTFLHDIEWAPKGTILVTPPWNFPCSIPTGGIAGALATGNSVIFKPAPEAVLVGWELVNLFWEAGVPKETLQFFNCNDEPVGSMLIKDPRVKMVILTGATSTAKLFLKMRPDIDLTAETGGKNALIITALSDRDLAVKDLVQSAFGHAGQKCSACSLAILEEEVYNDPLFRRQLKDAVSSLKVGSAWNLSTKVNPLIRSPSPDLLRGLTTLDEGEEWLVKPTQDPKNKNLWSPGVKFGVKPGSFMHQTELFGPVLGVMCAKNLEEAVNLANATPYGLTSGIHSLDDREQKYWMAHIVAGNCYMNRTITGAIVRRQPFGGTKESCFGIGAKAGGPNYVIQMMQAKQKDLPREREPLKESMVALNRLFHQTNYSDEDNELWNASLGSYAFYWNHYFSRGHDPSLILGQDNILRYVPREQQILRVQNGNKAIDVLRVIIGALTCNASLEVSVDESQRELLPSNEWFKNHPSIAIKIESVHQFLARLQRDFKVSPRVRYLSYPPINDLTALANIGCNAIIAPVLANGRLELLNHLREVSISSDYHRYGYLGLREGEKRSYTVDRETCGTNCCRG